MVPLLLGLLFAAPATAQTLPVVLEVPAAPYPEAALSQGLEATVLLQLDVDATGRVVDVLVVEPVGYGFDESARQAAYDMRLEPARDAAGSPAPARILYRYAFSADRVPVLSATGLVRDGELPLQGVVVEALGPDGAGRTARTDDDGVFRLADLPDGTWRFLVTADGYVPEVVSAEIRSGAVQELNVPLVRVAADEADADEELVVTGRFVRPELTERILDSEEIRYLPGTSGDVVRVVQNLPGVGRAPLGIGQLIIRGTAPEDSGYYLGGTRVPIVFHFSGLSTVMSSDLLDEVALLPGSYGVRYGRTLGGMVDLRPTRELPEQSRAYASVDLYQATGFAEYRLGRNTALTLAGRRSWVDAILNPVLGGGAATFQAPRYWDAQARVFHDAGALGTVDALFLFSDDAFRFVGGDDEAPQLALATQFSKAQLRWVRDGEGGWRSETSLLVGPQRNKLELPDGEAFEDALAANLRHEVYGTTGRLTLRAGVDVLGQDEAYVYDVPAFGDREEARALWISPAAYVEPAVRLGQVQVVPGLRVDPLFVEGGYSAVALDPRLAVAWDPTVRTTLEAASGSYSQHATLRQIVAEGGADADLGPARSWQTSVGVEQELTGALSVEATGYVNRLSGLVVGREDRFAFFTGPPINGPVDTAPYANDGTGWSAGVEGQVRLETEEATAWVTANVGRSTRVARPGDDTRLFRYDQPVTVTALGTWSLPRGWRVGGRVRVGSGDPYTPVENRVLSLDDRAFVPVYGEADSARLPAFFSTDVRIDKEWELKDWTLTAYLDLQNATNTQNPEVMSWTWDYGEETPVTGLPILPAFGIRGEI